MYDLSILIPDAGSDEGYFELHIDTAPDIGWAYTFLKYPSEAVKKPDTILVARKDGKPLAFTYVDKKLRHTVVSEGDPHSKTMGFLSIPTSWKKPKEFDFKIYCLNKSGPYSHEFVLDVLRYAAFDMGVSQDMIKPAFDRDNGAAYLQWIKYHNGEIYQPIERHLSYAVFHSFYHYDYESMFSTIKTAYGFLKKPFPFKKYNEILDKHISLIDYLLTRVIKEKWQRQQ